MIYLIEDKTSRRNDYGWSDKRIKQYKDAICVIDSISALLENIKTIMSSDSVLLYHESFANYAGRNQENEVNSFIDSVLKRSIKIAFFSGSKSQRTWDDYVCNLPPHVMYCNLEHFIRMHMNGDTDFRYLLFGKNPDLESKLSDSIIKTNNSNVDLMKSECLKNVFFYIASEESLDPPYESVAFNDSFDYECDDSNLSNAIQQDLTIVKYDGVYVPLCFGETLSDFMGLRFAMLIRFTNTANRLTPIIIYGEAEYWDMLSNECFDILKMPGVHYIHSDYQSIRESANSLKDISESEYKTGLNKIHLNVPSDIGDNHSVSNKWAIHRWAHALNIFDENDFTSVEVKIANSLYFKYLSSINLVTKTVVVNDRDIVINISMCKDSPKVLLVDDQADEGWYEAFCSILYDKNGIELRYIGDEIKHKCSEEIVEVVKNNIVTYSPDIVILDLRLCNSDFEEKSVKDLTGNHILRAVKQINRGIQVLIFSSTSKIWNYQYLSSQEDNMDGADGFIVKESPEDSKDQFYTRTVIKHFVSSLNQCCRMTYRKKLWKRMQEDIIKCCSSDTDYGKAVVRLLELAIDLLFVKQTNLPYASIFINLFAIVETTANQYIDDHAIQDIDGQYYFQFKNGDKLMRFDSNGVLMQDQVFKHEKKNLPYMQKICNTLHFLGSYCCFTYKLVEKRNAYIHPNMSKQDELVEFDVNDVIEAFELVHKLIKNQEKI